MGHCVSVCVCVCVCVCVDVHLCDLHIPKHKTKLKNMGVKLTNAFKHPSFDKAAFRRLVLCCKYNIKIMNV